MEYFLAVAVVVIVVLAAVAIAAVIAVVNVLAVVVVEPRGTSLWVKTKHSEIVIRSNKHLMMPNDMPKIPKIR